MCGPVNHRDSKAPAAWFPSSGGGWNPLGIDPLTRGLGGGGGRTHMHGIPTSGTALALQWTFLIGPKCVTLQDLRACGLQFECFRGPSVDPAQSIPNISPPEREAPQHEGQSALDKKAPLGLSVEVRTGLLTHRCAMLAAGSLKTRVTLECLESVVASPRGGHLVTKTKIKLVSKLQLKGLILAQNER